MLVRYKCQDCGNERHRIYPAGALPDEEIPCDCGGVMLRQLPRVRTAYRSPGFTKSSTGSEHDARA